MADLGKKVLFIDVLFVYKIFKYHGCEVLILFCNAATIWYGSQAPNAECRNVFYTHHATAGKLWVAILNSIYFV